ncbi:hypothetical protein [Flavobacterium sp.]|uniref:hypothetical protein n=1 Tax=Flavobacterium sp. TaxID=239 RepID=UPI004034C13C
MIEINIADIDNHSIKELSQYLFGTDSHTREIVYKKIAEVSTADLLHLLRRRCYTDIVALLAIREMEGNGFYGYSFSYDDKSVIQQDILKELILLPDYFWETNQRSYYKLKPIAKKNGIYVNLPENVRDLFDDYNPKPIVCTKQEIEQISFYLAMDTLSHFNTAMEEIRRPKRAVDEGIIVTLDREGNTADWEGNAVVIRSADDIKEHILPLIDEDGEYIEDFEKVMEKEVTICF